MLNIMETKDLAQWPAGSAEALHWRTAAMRLAWADIWRSVSDPRFIQIPVKRIASKEFAQIRAATIDMDRAECKAVASEELTASGNTTYLTVIDRDGNIASWICDSDSENALFRVQGIPCTLNRRQGAVIVCGTGDRP